MLPNTIDQTFPKLRVAIQPNIGLDASTRQSIIEILNNMLADEALLTAKTRSAHLNVRRPALSELRVLYKTQYHSLIRIADEVANRVRMLGGIVIGTHQEFLFHTQLREQPGVAPDILHLLADQEVVIRSMRESAKKCSEEYEDEGTSQMMVSSLREHEKMAWMLRSSIEPELTSEETF